ncbi:hypothetical protein Pelo_6281 [Pelomyxa schiedti]|nr:hypothetical protein Pelo_6281 [Pelomyxa schiedti]
MATGVSTVGKISTTSAPRPATSLNVPLTPSSLSKQFPLPIFQRGSPTETDPKPLPTTTATSFCKSTPTLIPRRDLEHTVDAPGFLPPAKPSASSKKLGPLLAADCEVTRPKSIYVVKKREPGDASLTRKLASTPARQVKTPVCSFRTATPMPPKVSGSLLTVERNKKRFKDVSQLLQKEEISGAPHVNQEEAEKKTVLNNDDPNPGQEAEAPNDSPPEPRPKRYRAASKTASPHLVSPWPPAAPSCDPSLPPIVCTQAPHFPKKKGIISTHLLPPSRQHPSLSNPNSCLSSKQQTCSVERSLEGEFEQESQSSCHAIKKKSTTKTTTRMKVPLKQPKLPLAFESEKLDSTSAFQTSAPLTISDPLPLLTPRTPLSKSVFAQIHTLPPPPFGLKHFCSAAMENHTEIEIEEEGDKIKREQGNNSTEATCGEDTEKSPPLEASKGIAERLRPSQNPKNQENRNTGDGFPEPAKVAAEKTEAKAEDQEDSETDPDAIDSNNCLSATPTRLGKQVHTPRTFQRIPDLESGQLPSSDILSLQQELFSAETESDQEAAEDDSPTTTSLHSSLSSPKNKKLDLARHSASEETEEKSSTPEKPGIQDANPEEAEEDTSSENEKDRSGSDRDNETKRKRNAKPSVEKNEHHDQLVETKKEPQSDSEHERSESETDSSDNEGLPKDKRRTKSPALQKRESSQDDDSSSGEDEVEKKTTKIKIKPKVKKGKKKTRERSTEEDSSSSESEIEAETQPRHRAKLKSKSKTKKITRKDRPSSDSNSSSSFSESSSSEESYFDILHRKRRPVTLMQLRYLSRTLGKPVPTLSRIQAAETARGGLDRGSIPPIRENTPSSTDKKTPHHHHKHEQGVPSTTTQHRNLPFTPESPPFVWETVRKRHLTTHYSPSLTLTAAALKRAKARPKHKTKTTTHNKKHSKKRPPFATTASGGTGTTSSSNTESDSCNNSSTSDDTE